MDGRPETVEKGHHPSLVNHVILVQYYSMNEYVLSISCRFEQV